MNVSTNAGEFSLSITNWLNLTAERIDAAAREATQGMCKDIIDMHPLDKTDPDEVVSKDDWVSSVGSEGADVDRSSPDGSGSEAQLNETIASWKPSLGEKFYFSNYKVQSVMLEYGLYSHNPSRKGARTTSQGFSTQAPQGFVGINTELFDKRLMEAAARQAGS